MKKKNRDRASGLGFRRRKGPVVTISDLRRNLTGEDEKEDRLSILPDDLIHHIFSFITCKYAVQTSVLSKHWVNLWTTLPYLNFLNLPFDSDKYFHSARFKPHEFILQRAVYNNFVSHFFRNRNHQSDILTLKIDLNRFNTNDTIHIVEYALSHHVTQLHILSGNNLIFQLSYHLLTTLHLSYCQVNFMDLTFTCLTTLHLEYVTFLDNERVLSFDRFNNLKELALVGGRQLHGMEVLEEVSINCPNLSSLTLSQFEWTSDPFRKFVVSAPSMSYFKLCFTSSHPVLSTGDGFPCLKEVELNIGIDEEDWESIFDVEKRKQLMQELIQLFHKFCGAKFLNLSFATIQALSRVPDFSEYQPSPYCNLESLNLLHPLPWQNDNLTKSIDHVIKYLLSNSPCAKIFIQDCSDRKFKMYNPNEDTLRRDSHGYHLMKSK